MTAIPQDTYLARVIAASCRADGTLDRERLCDALNVAPHDPVTIIAEAVLQIRLEHEQQQKDIKTIEAAYATTLTGVFKQNTAELQAILERHAESFEAAREQISILSEELAVARAEAKAKIAVDTDVLTKNSISIARNAEGLKAAATSSGFRVIVFTLGGFFAGAAGALLYVFIRFYHQ